MPLYPHRCEACGSRFDVRDREPAPVRECPSCGGAAPRVWTTSPVIIRPVGWDRSPEDPAYWKDLGDKEPRPRCLQ